MLLEVCCLVHNSTPYHVSCCPAILELTFVSFLSVVFSNASRTFHIHRQVKPMVTFHLVLAGACSSVATLDGSALECYLFFGSDLLVCTCVGAFSSLLLSRAKKI